MTSTSTTPTRQTASGRLAQWSRRWAPWRAVVGVLFAIAVLHALWALGISWPAQSMDQLADTVVGQRPFPSPAATWTVVLLLLAAVAVVVGSMSDRTSPTIRRLCCMACMALTGILTARGVLGELASITGLGGATTRFRILDIVVYSPLCLWAALGIYYRQSPPLTKSAVRGRGDHGP